MLRLLTLVLLLANLLYFGWTLGWFDAVVGIRALGDREPQRLQRQVQPELVQLSAVDAKLVSAAESASAPAATASAAASAAAPASSASAPAATPAPVLASAPATAAASAPTQVKAQLPAASAAVAVAPPKAASAALAAASVASAPPSAPARPAVVASAVAPAASASVNLACLEAGPFEASQLAAVETAIRNAAPAASWNQRRAGNGEWMIYMGPYPDDAWIERKKAELSRIRGGLPYDLVAPTDQYGRGISLGRFGSEAEANKRLEELRPRGIRTARVIQSAEGPGKVFLRIAKADPALSEKLAGVQWPTGQAGFTPCPAPR